MMVNGIGLKSVMNSLVPISRFNKGEASKIFDEVTQTGPKVVLKNNVPACVLITPEMFQGILDELEDCALELEALRRTAANQKVYSDGEVMAQLGLSERDLEGSDDVEIE